MSAENNQPMLVGNPYRASGGFDERGKLLALAMDMLAWMIPARDLRVRAAVLLGSMNDRCDPIWKQLRKHVARDDIDWPALAKAAHCLTRGRP